jgi:hypothetical protein
MTFTERDLALLAALQDAAEETTRLCDELDARDAREQQGEEE